MRGDDEPALAPSTLKTLVKVARDTARFPSRQLLHHRDQAVDGTAKDPAVRRCWKVAILRVLIDLLDATFQQRLDRRILGGLAVPRLDRGDVVAVD